MNAMQATTKFRIGWLVDGSGGAIAERQLVTVDNGRIVSIGPWSDDPGAGSEDGEQQPVDLSGCTVLPPLTDALCHLFMSATTDLAVRERQLSAGWEELLPAMRQHAEDALKHGIFAVRDGGDRRALGLRFSREGSVPRLLVRSCGCGWHRRGRYGRLLGRTSDEYGLPLAAAFAEALARGEDAGAEFVSIVQSEPTSLCEYGAESAPQFTREELTALVRRAADCGRKVMVSANGEEPVRRAVAAGCHSLEHGFFMGDDNLKRLRDSDTVWVPAVFTMRACRQNLALLGGRARRSVLDRLVEHQLEQLARARELGVRVAVGSNAGHLGILHGEGVMEEMKLFRRAGYSLSETICCSSTVGGSLLGVAAAGGLVPGAAASFLVARGTPSQLPRKIVYLEAIYVDGRKVA